MPEPPLIDAAEAAQRLNVKAATLYAYVSRGVITSHRRAVGRGSWFDPLEVDELLRRRGGGRASGLDLAIATSITQIDGSRLWYRGLDATALAASATYEEVCGLLWAQPGHDRFTAPVGAEAAVRAAAGSLGPSTRLLDRLSLAVTVAASADPLRFDVSPAAVAGSARALIAVLVDQLPLRRRQVRPLALSDGRRVPHTIAARLWARLATGHIDGGVATLNGVLILLADHELATSTLAARLAASTRADPYAAVSAAIAVLDGPLHGTVSEEVVGLLAEANGSHGASAAVGGRLRRGERLPGFGHPLYETGDPRGAAMLASLDRLGLTTPASRQRREIVTEVLAAAARMSVAPPSSDFALGALTFVTGMPAASGAAIFAIARTAGWVAHAMEEYQAPPLRFRGRALYTGRPAEPAPPPPGG